MSNARLMNMAAGARAAIADPGRITLVGSDANPRFELFHAASSLCSQKVRTVLFEKQLPYRSNDMMILSSMGPDGVVPAEHYHPPYVRLRLIAGQEERRELVWGYSGRTSVETEGFDPCAVPLLVDYEAGRVIADSRRICCYLDAVSRAPVQLVPEDADARAQVMHQVSIVDRIPNGTLLYGFHPDADLRPEALKTVMQTVYDHKIRALEAMIDANADDAELVAAYRAKIAKEQGGKSVCLRARAVRHGQDKKNERQPLAADRFVALARSEPHLCNRVRHAVSAVVDHAVRRGLANVGDSRESARDGGSDYCEFLVCSWTLHRPAGRRIQCVRARGNRRACRRFQQVTLKRLNYLGLGGGSTARQGRVQGPILRRPGRGTFARAVGRGAPRPHRF